MVPSGSCIILDTMAILHSFPKTELPKTWGEFAKVVLLKIIRVAAPTQYSRLDVIFDTYPTVSINSLEHERRHQTADQTSVTMDYRETSRLGKKMFEGVLKSNESKTLLIKFLVDQWSKSSELQVYDTVYFALDTTCIAVRQNQVQLVPDLACNHIEADTRLLLHAHHAARSYRTVLIMSPDSDVALIALPKISLFPEGTVVLFRTGKGSSSRTLNLTAIAESMGHENSTGILGYQAFSGCDTTSAFCGKGKKRGIRLALNHNFMSAFAKLGEGRVVTADVVQQLETFVCKLYGLNIHSVNDARYKLFCTKAPNERRLPPCRNALIQHVLRANYQTFINRQALTQQMTIPDPNEHGWVIKEEVVYVKWFTCGIAPPGLLEHESCRCAKSKCVTNLCKCHKSGILCTHLCACCSCENVELTEREFELDNDCSDEDCSDDGE